jgi:hypothetical protein
MFGVLLTEKSNDMQVVNFNSSEYTQETIDLMTQAVRRADAQVLTHCADIYKSAVVCGKRDFSVEHPSFKGIETIVKGLADDADMIRDVCPDTHEYLCRVSRVYSCSEDAYIDFVGERTDDVFDVLYELVVDYIDEKLGYTHDVALMRPWPNNKQEYHLDIQGEE